MVRRRLRKAETPGEPFSLQKKKPQGKKKPCMLRKFDIGSSETRRGRKSRQVHLAPAIKVVRKNEKREKELRQLDHLLENSKLTEKDAERIGHKIKREMSKRFLK